MIQPNTEPRLFNSRGLLLALILYMLAAHGSLAVSAQPIQPTNQAVSDTSNPQTQPSADLGAPVTPLQNSTGPQVLGAAAGQPGLMPLRIATSQPPAVAVDTPANTGAATPAEQSSERPSDSGGLSAKAAGGTAAVLVLLAIYWVAKRKASR